MSLLQEGLQLGGVLQEIERPHHLTSDGRTALKHGFIALPKQTHPHLRAAGAFSSEDLLLQVLSQGSLLATAARSDSSSDSSSVHEVS